MEHRHELVTRKRAPRGIDDRDEVLEVVVLGLVVFVERKAGKAVERLPVGDAIGPVARHDPLEAVEAPDPHRGGELVELRVGAERHDVVIAGEAEVAHEAQACREVAVGREDRAPFEALHELRGVEAHDRGRAEAAHRTTPVGAAECVGRIEDEGNAPCHREGLERLDGTHAAPQMHAHDRGRAVGHRGGDRVGIEHVRVLVHIGEHRLAPLPGAGVRRGDEGERREDHLACHAEGLEQELHADRGVAHGHGLDAAAHLPESRLELPRERAVVREPPRVEHRVEPRMEGGSVGDAGRAHVARGGEGGRSAAHRQLRRKARRIGHGSMVHGGVRRCG